MEASLAKIEKMPSLVLLNLISLLSINDIVILSDRNRWLNQNIIGHPEMRRIGGVTIYLRNFSHQVNNIHECEVCEIEITGITYMLKFLRLFGEKIKSLDLNCVDSTEIQVIAVFNYINRFCFNLEKLRLSNLTHSIGRSLKRPFDSVKKLIFLNCTFSHRLNNINLWFPSVLSISFLGKNQFKDLSKIMVHYNSLTSLYVTNRTMDKNIADDLQGLNPGVIFTFEYSFREFSPDYWPNTLNSDSSSIEYVENIIPFENY